MKFFLLFIFRIFILGDLFQHPSPLDIVKFACKPIIDRGRGRVQQKRSWERDRESPKRQSIEVQRSHRAILQREMNDDTTTT
jgi:hypothetical protein